MIDKRMEMMEWIDGKGGRAKKPLKRKWKFYK